MPHTRSRLYPARALTVGHSGAEFWAAFFYASTLAIPIVFYATHWVPEVGSLILALSGVLLATLAVICAAACQVCGQAESLHHASGAMLCEKMSAMELHRAMEA